MAQSSRKATVEVREALLTYLDAPNGSVVIGRRATASDDVIVVQMMASNAVDPRRRIATFSGFQVEYETISRPKLGSW